MPALPLSAIKDSSSPTLERRISLSNGDGKHKIVQANGETQEVLFIACAKHDFQGQSESELSLKKGDLIVVLQQNADGWWGGECNGAQGFFPASYVDIQDPLDVVTLLQEQK